MMYCPRGAGPDSPFKSPLNGEMVWYDDGTCSYCGSLSEDEFFRLVGDKGVLTTTDKDYKVYVDHPETGRKKFYFQHLSNDGKKKFVEYMNENKFVMDGRFYVLPFFVRLERK